MERTEVGTFAEAVKARSSPFAPARNRGKVRGALSEIVLTTLNARYIHAAFGLRYLMANLGDLQPRATLVEFDINQRPLEIVEAILARDPRIVGLWRLYLECHARPRRSWRC